MTICLPRSNRNWVKATAIVATTHPELAIVIVKLLGDLRDGRVAKAIGQSFSGRAIRIILVKLKANDKTHALTIALDRGSSRSDTIRATQPANDSPNPIIMASRLFSLYNPLTWMEKQEKPRVMELTFSWWSGNPIGLFSLTPKQALNESTSAIQTSESWKRYSTKGPCR
jgi:hypothetical protein